MKERNIFTYGVQYYRPPNPPRGERKRDLKEIKRLGFNTIKVWAMWNWCNPKPDVFDFEELKELLDWAEENDLKVIINTILENAPYWLLEEYPEARYRTADNQPIDLQARENTPSGGWPGLCLDHQWVREKAKEFLTRLTEEFKTHPALLGWDIWNEPHMEPVSIEWDLPERNLYCYCESTLKEFINWLKSRYENIEKLNSLWHTRYTAWHQVMPPRRWGAYPAMMDWLRFIQDNMARIMAWRASVIKAVDKGHFVMSHIGLDGIITRGVFKTSVDDWKLAREVERWGCSWFPRWSGTDFCLSSLHLDITLSAGEGKICWVSELQAGGAPDPKSIFVDKDPTLEEIAGWNWLAVALGMKGILYWQYRPEMLGPESPGLGLCELEGKPNPKVEVASRIGQILNKYSIFREGGPSQPLVGIIHNKDVHNLIFCATQGDEPICSSVEGIYRTFWEANIPVRFLNVDTVSLEKLREYHILYYPIPLCMSEEQADKLKKYVARGGILICECHIAQYNLYGYCSQKVPGCELDKVFGCVRKKTFRIKKETIRVEGKKIVAREFRESYELTTGKAIGFYEDGEVAIVKNTYGKGKCFLVGSLVFGEPENSLFLLSFLPPSVKPDVEVTPSIFCRTLRGEKEKVVILVNPKERGREVKVKLEDLDKVKSVEVVWGKKKINYERKWIVLNLEGFQSTVLICKYR